MLFIYKSITRPRIVTYGSLQPVVNNIMLCGFFPYNYYHIVQSERVPLVAMFQSRKFSKQFEVSQRPIIVPHFFKCAVKAFFENLSTAIGI